MIGDRKKYAARHWIATAALLVGEKRCEVKKSGGGTLDVQGSDPKSATSERVGLTCVEKNPPDDSLRATSLYLTHLKKNS